MGEVLEIVARFFKLTPKKRRYNAEKDGVSVSIYVEKGRNVPAKLEIVLLEDEDFNKGKIRIR